MLGSASTVFGVSDTVATDVSDCVVSVDVPIGAVESPVSSVLVPVQPQTGSRATIRTVRTKESFILPHRR